MKKCKPIFLILVLVFFLISCGSGQRTDTGIQPETKTFVSEKHGDIGIFPAYNFMGTYELATEKSFRQYNLWENPYEGKYIMIIQIVPKEGTFPPNLVWNDPQTSLYIKGMRAAYDGISSRSYSIMQKLGAEFPPCFILAQEVHVHPKEALFRILIVPDKMCTGDYEPVMEELDRVLIINPLG